MKRVVISVTNDLSNDQRLHRVASTLHANGHEVLLVGRSHSKSKPLSERPYNTHLLTPFFEHGKLFYLEFNLRLALFLFFKKTDIFYATDMDTLVPNAFSAFFRRKKLIYDSHEYFTEVPELITRKFTRAIWLFLEKLILPWLKWMITVNESIAEEYRKKYGIEVGVVRNLPIRRIRPPQPDPANQIIIYQGALNLSRGIDLMIRSMEFLPGYTLRLVGRGDVMEQLKALAVELKLEKRVDFTDFLPMESLAKLTSEACIGLSLEEDHGMSYHFALPNKLFDYIQAGTPAIVSDLPEMKRIIDQYKVGEVLPLSKRTPQDLANLIKSMVEDSERWYDYHEKCQQASIDLCWEVEENRLLAYF